MKNLVVIFALLIGHFSFGQSISGNISSAERKVDLSYVNVDIYKDKKLVASVLTDKLGNFNVALDTGTYECVMNYSRHFSLTKTIRVLGDETMNASLNEDPAKTPIDKEHGKTEDVVEFDEAVLKSSSAKLIYSDVMSYPSKMKGGTGMAMRTISPDGATSGISDRNNARSGLLTAGEINDFSKWKLWNDLEEGEFKTFSKAWNLNPKGRYTVQVNNKVGLPIANAKVELMTSSNKTVYSSRTDNTGKAELWNSITGESVSEKLKIKVSYDGFVKWVRQAKPFSKGLNYATLNIECQDLTKVDIAFVVDATGSMGDELSYLQKEMNDIIFKSKQISSRLNFRFGNVFYRDKGDEYLTRTMDFSRILSESVDFIDAQRAGGGGDYEEAVATALDTALHKLSWSEDARAKILFLVLDAPPHNTEENREKLAKIAKKAAEMGVRIVPVGASGINKTTEYLMRSLAISTNGTYTFLTDHSGIGNSHIEPSTDKYKVESFNDILVRILKSYTYMPDCQQQMPDLDLDYPDSVITVPADSSAIDDKDSAIVIPAIEWKYYPNPTKGIINITSNQDIDELFLSDLSGKLLQSLKNIKKERIYRMDLSEYNTGIYLLRYEHKGRWISGKVVLHR